MRISITSSMVFAALTLSSVAIARPINSTTESVAQIQGTGGLDSMLTGLPMLGPILTPVASLLDSVGLNDPAKLASGSPLTDEQKETLQKLRAALADIANEVKSGLPVPILTSPAKDLSRSAFTPRNQGLDGELKKIPVISSLFGPIASLLNTIGLGDITTVDSKVPLTDLQRVALQQLKVELLGAVEGVEAGLPPPSVLSLKRGYTRRQFGDEGSGWGALFDDESGTLDPEDGLMGYLKRETSQTRGLDSVINGLPVVGPVLAPVTSLLDSLGLGDITSKMPLSSEQKDVIAKLEAAISTVADKVKSTIPVGLPVSLPI